MQRKTNNIKILESHCYVTSNLLFFAQKYSKCSDPYTLLCDIIMFILFNTYSRNIIIHIDIGEQIHTARYNYYGGFFYKEDFIFKKSAKILHTHTHKKKYIYIYTDINIQITYPPPVILYRYLT